MEKLTVGVVGLGAMGQIHTQNLATLPSARLLALASRRAVACRQELDHFIAWIQGQAEAAASGEEGRAALAIALAATESFRTGPPKKLR
ncbi:MAG: hypothetical protein JSV36_21865 [Anaerolineae bacterium]|nr:MAG: hypothetical protein JSV36_21865 [Anaerolineae bacterium]